MDVEKIITEYLKSHNCSGLYNVDQGCRCSLNNLAPWDEISSTCKPEYKHSPIKAKEMENEKLGSSTKEIKVGFRTIPVEVGTIVVTERKYLASDMWKELDEHSASVTNDSFSLGKLFSIECLNSYSDPEEHTVSDSLRDHIQFFTAELKKMCPSVTHLLVWS